MGTGGTRHVALGAVGCVGVIQRFELPIPSDAPRLANGFDVAHLRADRPRSAAMIVETKPGAFVLRELGSKARQD